MTVPVHMVEQGCQREREVKWTQLYCVAFWFITTESYSFILKLLSETNVITAEPYYNIFQSTPVVHC